MTSVTRIRAQLQRYLLLFAIVSSSLLLYNLMFGFNAKQMNKSLRFSPVTEIDRCLEQRASKDQENCVCENGALNGLTEENIRAALRSQRTYAKQGEGLRKIGARHIPPEVVPDQPVERLPKALILGFAKCGTVALVTFLPLHPDIVSPNWELDYFCDHHYFHYDLLWYKDRMPKSLSHQITIEKSPCYIEEVPQSLVRIYAYNSSIKLMITVRNPVERILSNYGQRSSGTFAVNTTLDQFIKFDNGSLRVSFILKKGDYIAYVKEVYKLFPRNQILIIDGDRLIEDPLVELQRIETFLGIRHYLSEEDIIFDKEKGFYCPRNRKTRETKCLGGSKGRKHAEMRAEDRDAIMKLLKPHNEEFFKLVGRRFDWD